MMLSQSRGWLHSCLGFILWACYRWQIVQSIAIQLRLLKRFVKSMSVRPLLGLIMGRSWMSEGSRGKWLLSLLSVSSATTESVDCECGIAGSLMSLYWGDTHWWMEWRVLLIPTSGLAQSWRLLQAHIVWLPISAITIAGRFHKAQQVILQLGHNLLPMVTTYLWASPASMPFLPWVHWTHTQNRWASMGVQLSLHC